MADNTEVKAETLPDLDDLLQCPVCYEIPSGQIFQCNQGHHVCGRCKLRLNECPVCRALFFGTRNYAMEELIANVKRLRAFKLGGKVTTGTVGPESNTPAVENAAAADTENNLVSNGDDDLDDTSQTTSRPPPACRGLFRCLCCKNGSAERLPSARLLNHLRYYHSPELIEGKSENGEYLQAWQFSTEPGRLVTAVRVADMGVFFLVIEIKNYSVCAWLMMAAAPWVAHEFTYTVTISGTDREAIFSDCVWSVRSCEGSLKKRGHCLVVNGMDARALIAPPSISGKLSVRRTPLEQLAQQAPPRAVLRVASRAPRAPAHDIEPFLQDLQQDVERLSRAFATLGREAEALRTEATVRARNETGARTNRSAEERTPVAPPQPPNEPAAAERTLSRNARRRLRQRLRAALNSTEPEEPVPQFSNGNQATAPTANISTAQRPRINGSVSGSVSLPPGNIPFHGVHSHLLMMPPPVAPPQLIPPPVAPSTSAGINGQLQNGNNTRTNKKKRRHRR